MKIGQDTVVKVEISMQVKDGNTPDILRRPSNIEFIYGRDRVHPVLEKALLGHAKDDNVEVEIPPEQAFGPYKPELLNEIPLERLSRPENIREGCYYEEPGGAFGRSIGFTVKEVHEDYVVADFNHPAAGKTINVNAKVLDVRRATVMDIMTAINAARSAGGG